MIDASTARAYDTIDERAHELFNAYTPGFVPTERTLRTSGRARADVSASGLDVVAPDGTYFVGADSHDRRFYTRNGSFTLHDGTLRTQNGAAVMGFPAGSTTLGPLQQDPVDVALRRGHDVRLEADGTLAYTRKIVDPKSGASRPERVVVGRIALARFPAGTSLASPDGVHLTAPADVQPMIGAPAEHGPTSLLTHRIDRGSYNIKEGLAELHNAYVAFDGLRAATHMESTFAKTATQLIK